MKSSPATKKGRAGDAAGATRSADSQTDLRPNHTTENTLLSRIDNFLATISAFVELGQFVFSSRNQKEVMYLITLNR